MIRTKIVLVYKEPDYHKLPVILNVFYFIFDPQIHGYKINHPGHNKLLVETNEFSQSQVARNNLVILGPKALGRGRLIKKCSFEIWRSFDRITFFQNLVVVLSNNILSKLVSLSFEFITQPNLT